MIPKDQSNRLINEKSPYLLQHAHNPVEWYSWSDEAFKKAKQDDKPIFLSIGYSTCHWCHVMERESFEDEGVAKILNKYFVSIKVDREERPDIDTIYMNVCQALTGSGGWPLSIFMTPDKKPFYAGTYFPRVSYRGHTAFTELLHTIADVWENKRESIQQSTERIDEAVRQMTRVDEAQAIETDIVEETYNYFQTAYDPVYGGFSRAPKFPNPNNLLFLLRYWKLKNDSKALHMVEKTLEGMYRGGIYDHVGFGFTRYSTDERWLVPHFEKMLYDNALLTLVYIEAFLATKKQKYKDIANDILRYVLRDMQADDGGLFTAEDADSEGEEGKFYVWTPDEVCEVLGEEAGKFFCDAYNLTEEGNFEGKGIPNLIDNKESIYEQDIARRLADDIVKLFEAREKRVHPYKDDKILTSWNGLMLVAFAVAGRVFECQEYIEAAERGMDFILQKLVNEQGRLLARYREGEAKFLAYDNDYAYIIWALLELSETTADTGYLQRALELNDDFVRLFWDDENGGLYKYGKDAEELILRPKEITDYVIPSANAVATLNWLRMSLIVEDERLQKLAERQFQVFGRVVDESPMASPFMVIAYMYYHYGYDKIVLAGNSDDYYYRELVSAINTKYMPFTTRVFINKETEHSKYDSDHFAQYQIIENKPTAYICKDKSCMAPTTDKAEIMRILGDPIGE